MDPHKFIPFSGDQRNCIGQHFAMKEMKIILCEFIQKFDFRVVDGYELKMSFGFVYEPVYPMQMILTPRLISDEADIIDSKPVSTASLDQEASFLNNLLEKDFDLSHGARTPTASRTLDVDDVIKSISEHIHENQDKAGINPNTGVFRVIHEEPTESLETEREENKGKSGTDGWPVFDIAPESLEVSATNPNLFVNKNFMTLGKSDNNGGNVNALD